MTDAAEPVNWRQVWAALAVALRVHVEVGRRHLLTEDVVRFATVAVLADHGVSADRLAAERTVAGIGRVDLMVDPPAGAAVEFKFPREASEKNAADTDAFGETLRDFYRLARLDVGEAWAVQVLRPAFVRYLRARSEVRWTAAPGETLVLPAGLSAVLPASARAQLSEWATDEVRARCELAEALGDDLLVAYRVARAAPAA